MRAAGGWWGKGEEDEDEKGAEPEKVTPPATAAFEAAAIAGAAKYISPPAELAAHAPPAPIMDAGQKACGGAAPAALGATKRAKLAIDARIASLRLAWRRKGAAAEGREEEEEAVGAAWRCCILWRAVGSEVV